MDCLSGSARTAATTSSTTSDWKACSLQPGGTVENDGDRASAVVARDRRFKQNSTGHSNPIKICLSTNTQRTYCLLSNLPDGFILQTGDDQCIDKLLTKSK